MKTQLLKFFPWIVIAALAFVIFFQRSCNTPTNIIGNTKPKTVTVDGKKYDVLKHTSDTTYLPSKPQIVYVPGDDIYKDTTIYVPVPATVDTQLILKDYFAKKVYTDTLRLNDSAGYVALRDTITKNSISGRIWDAHINKTLIRDTFFLAPKVRNQIYIGGTLGAIQPAIPMAGINLALKTKKDKMYQIGAGYTAKADMYVQGSMFWKITFKRK